MRAIDADALEKILEKIPAADIKNMGGQAYVLVKLSQVFNVIDNQPTIEPERKKGKWIPQDHNKTNGIASTLVYYYPKCSVCGHCDNYTNFCSNCGADMRGEQE